MPFKDASRNRWRGQVRFKGKSYKASFNTKREAVKWEAEKKAALTRADLTTEPTAMDLLTLSNEYLDHAKLRFVHKTFDHKRRACKRLIDYLGNVLVEEIKPKDIQAFLNSVAQNGSNGLYNSHYKHLHAMWEWGRSFQGLQYNPLSRIKRLPEKREPQYTPSTEDVLKLIAAATREERVFLHAYLQTGARRSEVLRWTWNEDINFEKRQIRLTTRKTRDGGELSEWLPMNDRLYDELWWWWNNRPIKDSPYVFVSTRPINYGQPFTTRRRFLKGLCERAGIRPFGYHALRRYVASVLADTHKVSAKSIQRILRHQSVNTTERYIQSINHDLGAIMDLLGSDQERTQKRTQDKKNEVNWGANLL